MQIRQFNLALIGAAGVGKTTFYNKHKTGHFTNDSTNDSNSLGFLYFNVSYGNVNEIVRLNLWEFKTLENFNPDNFAGVILMFSLCDMNSYYIINSYHQFLGQLPRVICGNKTDNKFREVKASHIQVSHPYYDISAKSCYNKDKPFLCLLKLLIANNLKINEGAGLLSFEQIEAELDSLATQPYQQPTVWLN